MSLARAHCMAAAITVVAMPDSATEFLCGWSPKGVDPRLLDSVLLDMGSSWERQRAIFGGVFVPETVRGPHGISWARFLAVDEDGDARTVWLVDLVRLQ